MHNPHGKHGKKRAEQCIENQILKITAALPVLCLLVDCAIQRMQNIHTLGWPRCEYVTLFGEIAHVELV